MPRQGFTLIEMLVAMMVILIYLSLALQILVAAAYFRAKSEQINDAYTWIQEDYEAILDQAKHYENLSPYPSDRCNPRTPEEGLAAGFVETLNQGTRNPVTNLGPRNFGGQGYTLIRTAHYATSSHPLSNVRLDYEVVTATQGDRLVSVSTEVLLNAIFKCLGQ